MATKTMFDKDIMTGEERGFLEDLLEVIPNVVDSEDTGNITEYYDEYGCVLFSIEIVGDEEYIFHFYDYSYPINEETLQKIKEILCD